MEHKLDKIKKNKKIRPHKLRKLRKVKKYVTGKKVFSKLVNKKQDKVISGKIFHTIQDNKIVSFFDKLFSHKHHKLILPIASFFDTIFMIIPIDVITIAYILKHNKTKILPFAVINSMSTAIGTFVVYLFGYYYYQEIINILGNIASFLHINTDIIDYNKVIESISLHQVILVFTTAATSTVPFVVLAFFAGGLKFNIVYFLISVFFGRMVKFIFVGYLTKYYGPAALKKASQNAIPVIIVLFFIIFLKIFFM